MTEQHKRKNKPQDGNHPIISPAEEIKVGNMSGNVGVAIGSGAQAVVTQSIEVTTDEIAIAFKVLQQKVNAMPGGPDKNIADNVVKMLEAEARKGEHASESQVQKWINFLAETAPDAWEVAMDMFANPIKGVGTVFKKIADKAKSEQETNKTKQSEK